MSELKLKKYEVSGRMRIELEYTQIVEAKTENQACKLAEQIIYARCGINESDVIDDEIYCERLKDD